MHPDRDGIDFDSETCKLAVVLLTGFFFLMSFAALAVACVCVPQSTVNSHLVQRAAAILTRLHVDRVIEVVLLLVLIGSAICSGEADLFHIVLARDLAGSSNYCAMVACLGALVALTASASEVLLGFTADPSPAVLRARRARPQLGRLRDRCGRRRLSPNPANNDDDEAWSTAAA